MEISIKKIYQTFRSSEWWEYKISPILAIAYASSFILQTPITVNIRGILFLIFSIIIGAIFVSTINDITDVADDLASGKKNRMANISPQYRWIIPTICAGMGIACVFVMIPDYISVIIYILPWIAYSMYSFKPIRLKERGFAGILADASGAHLFISLLMISSLSFINSQSIDWLWFGMVGSWSLVFGIRGILWHQFYDRENDLLTETRTYVTSLNLENFKKYEIIIFGIEALLFLGILIKLGIFLLFFLLTIYILIAYLRYRVLNYIPVLITNPSNAPNQILMLDFYMVFFPIGLLLYSIFIDPLAWIICGVHILLFHGKLVNILKDIILIAKLSILKIAKIPK